MGVRILHDENNSEAAFYCSTSMWAFGPVISSDTEAGLDAAEVAERFLVWGAHHGKRDFREYADNEFEKLYGEWRDAPDRFKWMWDRNGRIVEADPPGDGE